MSAGSWSAVEVPLTVEYSRSSLDEIREIVWEGFQRLTRGGLEVGGVLYGNRRERTVEILGVQPIACQHAFGPGFVLSQGDRTALQNSLEKGPEDARLKNASCLGWFVSHTRSGIALTASDTEIYEAYFPEPWQITLVVHPERDGSMRGGFFVRELGGAIKTSGSYREFDFPERPAPARPASGPPDRRELRRSRANGAALANGMEPASASEPPQAPLDVPPAQTLLATEPAAESRSIPIPTYMESPPSSRRFKWLWLAIGVLVAMGLAFLGGRWASAPRSFEPVSLTLIERDGQLRVEWNPEARAIAAAVSGALDIADGGETQTIALTPQDLTRGELPYMRKSGDVEVRMSLRGAKGQQVQEASRFLGNPPQKKSDTAELDSLQRQRQTLQAEADRLRGENATQAARIKELETALRVLQDRLALSGR